MMEIQIPGGAYINETGTRQEQIPGSSFVNEIPATQPYIDCQTGVIDFACSI